MFRRRKRTRDCSMPGAAGEDLRTAAVAFGGVSGVRPLPRVANATARMDEAEPIRRCLDDKRKAIAREARNRAAPFRCIDLVKPPSNDPSTRERATSARGSIRPRTRRRRAGCVMRSFAGARGRCCLDAAAAGRGAGERGRCGRRAPWAAASRWHARTPARVRLLDASPEPRHARDDRSRGAVRGDVVAIASTGPRPTVVLLIAPVDDYAALATRMSRSKGVRGPRGKRGGSVPES